MGSLEKAIEQATGELNDSSELGEVAKEFNKSTPSSSNLTKDEHILTWRATHILKRLSPKSVDIIRDFIDSKRSVGGWNTNKKVEAITGVQQQRSGNGFVEKMLSNRGGK